MIAVNPEHAKILHGRELFLACGTMLEFNGSLGVPCKTHSGVQFECTHLGSMSTVSGGTSIMYTTIGNYSSIGHGSTVVLPHPTDRLTTSIVSYKKGFNSREFPGNCRADPFPLTFIGNDVWVGAHVVIKAGVRIGDGAIIGAGAVVTKDIPPFAVAVGNAAKVIRYRFDESTQERVKRCRWFDYDWSAVELPWDNAMLTLSKMEEHLAAGNVPLANKVYVYRVKEGAMDLLPGVRNSPIV